MSVASPPVWVDPTSGTIDITSGIWTAAAVDGIASDLAILGGASGTLGIAGKANQLTNGGMETWQRGAGPFTATGSYSADRWLLSLGGTSTVSINRDAGNADVGSQYALSAILTFGGAS